MMLLLRLLPEQFPPLLEAPFPSLCCLRASSIYAACSLLAASLASASSLAAMRSSISSRWLFCAALIWAVVMKGVGLPKKMAVLVTGYTGEACSRWPPGGDLNILMLRGKTGAIWGRWPPPSGDWERALGGWANPAKGARN